MKVFIPIIIALFLCGCNPPSTVKVSLAADNASVAIKGLDVAVIQEINRDTSKSSWLNLVPVFRMPADTDMKPFQTPQPGSYTVKNGAVLFRPDTPFVKHHTYYVRFYQYDKSSTTLDYLKGQGNIKNVHYIDLVFNQ